MESQEAWGRARARSCVWEGFVQQGQLFTFYSGQTQGMDKTEQSHWRLIHPFGGRVLSSRAFSPRQASADEAGHTEFTQFFPGLPA